MEFTIKESPTSADVHLNGDLTDNVGPALKRLGKALTHGTIRFHCENIGRISSVGCLRWQQFVHDLGDRRIEFLRCSTAFADAAFMLPALLGSKGRVLSLYASYTCRSCRSGLELLIDVDAVKKSKKFPVATCSKCAEALEADLDVEQIELLP